MATQARWLHRPGGAVEAEGGEGGGGVAVALLAEPAIGHKLLQVHQEGGKGGASVSVLDMSAHCLRHVSHLPFFVHSS